MVTRLQKIATKKVLIILAVIWALMSIYENIQYMFILGFAIESPFDKYNLYLLFLLLLNLIRVGLIIAAMIKLHSDFSKKLFLASFVIITVISAAEAMSTFFFMYPLYPLPYVELLTILLENGAIFLLFALACYHKPIWAKITCVLMVVGICITLCVNVIVLFQPSLSVPLPNSIIKSSSWIDSEKSDVIYGDSLKMTSPSDNTNFLAQDSITISRAPTTASDISIEKAPHSYMEIDGNYYIYIDGNYIEINGPQTNTPIFSYTDTNTGIITSGTFVFVQISPVLYCAIVLLYLIRLIPSKKKEEVTDTAPAITVEDRLTILKSQHDNGQLTDEEYEAKKMEILKTDE